MKMFTPNRIRLALLIALAANLPIRAATTIDHSPKWSNGGTSLTYNLTDLDNFAVGSYQYCKWGNLQDRSDALDIFNTDLFFTSLTQRPYSNLNDDIFIADDTDYSIHGYVFPNDTQWYSDKIYLPGVTIPIRLYRYLHFNNELYDASTENERTVTQVQNNTFSGTPLTGNETKLIILFHGWNGGRNSDCFYDYDNSDNAGEGFSEIVNYLKQVTNGTDWKVVKYHWEADSDTGLSPSLGSVLNPSEITGATRNGTEAAEIGHLHGQHLGALLANKFPNLQKIHVIAHSAGSWAARGAVRHLLDQKTVIAQITLLDPYIPAASGENSSLKTSVMSFLDNLNLSGLDRLENYYDDDDLGFAAFGTQETFEWTANDINKRVDMDPISGEEISHYSSHSGPVYFYADTIYHAHTPSTTNIPDLAKFSNIKSLGWYNSLYLTEPLFSSQPQDQSFTAGQTITLKAPAYIRRSYREGSTTPGTLLWVWIKTGQSEPTVTETDTLTITNATAADAGEYIVVVMDANRTNNMTLGTPFTLSFVTSTVPGKPSTPSPANNTTDWPTSINASWNAGNNATSYNIYFGTSQATLSKVATQTGLVYTFSSLSPNTTYYWRVDAINTVGTTTGDVWKFTTAASPGTVTLPSVTTGNATSITDISATVTVNVTNDGGTQIFVYSGIAYGTSPNPDIDNDHILLSGDMGTGVFTCHLNLLTASTTYYVRAFAQNEAGIAYGNQISFTTGSTATYDLQPPTLTITSPDTGVTVNAATLTISGTATDAGTGNNGIASVKINDARANNDTVTGSGTANWSKTITLSQGINLITVIATDGKGLFATKLLSVTYTPPPSPTRIINLPVTLSFGTLTVGETSSKTLTIQNKGNSALTVNSISYPAGYSGNWTSGTIAAGASKDVIVTFKPTVAQSYSANLTVNSNATSGISTCALIGIATTPIVTDIQPPTLIITSPADGATVSTANVTISGTATDSGRGNNGIASVTINGTRANNDTATGSGIATWSRIITLSQGLNLITVIAKDGVGWTDMKMLKVTYSPSTPPSPAKPVITTQPQSRSVWAGESVTFSVTATSQGGAPLYQWNLNGKAIKGATGSSYTLPKTTAKNAGTYTVTVSNAGGTDKVTSTSATLTVNVPVKPKLTAKPAAKVETGLGKTVTLSVSASGNPPPTFQWLLNGNPVPGATSATLTIANVKASDLGKYSVVITSGPNRITTAVTTLEAILPPVIETPAVGKTEYSYALAAKGAKLSIKIAKNKAKPTYQWLLNGNPIQGATKATYTAKADGAYSVRVTNGAGTVEKLIGNIKLVTPPKFDAAAGLLAKTPAGVVTDKPEVVANVGQSVVFTAKLASGTGPFTWTWFKNGKQVVRTYTGSSLTDTFTAANITAADKYSVQVESVKDAKGKPLAKAKSKTVAIKIVVPPTVVITTLPAKLIAVPGKPVTIAAKATGTAKLVYEWRGPDGKIIPGANKASLTLKPAANTATVTAGIYTVRVTNGAGDKYAATASATVTAASTPASASAATTAAASAASAKTANTATHSDNLTMSAKTDTSTDRTDATREKPATLDANSTLRLANVITGEVTLLDLADASLKNLRYEVTDANAGASTDASTSTGHVSFARIVETDGDATWETVTLVLVFGGKDSGNYELTTLRTQATVNGDLVDETETATGVFEID
jgi:hypothetical protein